MQRLRGAGRVNASALPPSPRLVQTLDQFLSPLVAHDPQNMRAANWAFSITERRHNQTDLLSTALDAVEDSRAVELG